MTEKHLTEELNSPDNDVSFIVANAFDRMLHNYTHEERMFFAMLYALNQYDRIESTEHDITDYRIAADETTNAIDTEDKTVSVHKKRDDE